jgi:hypothetical protein
VAEILADARASLFQEAGRSRVLGVSGAIALVTGALGGAIGGATGGTTGMLLGGVGGLLPPAIQAVTVARQRVPGFLRRHYLVFEKKAETDHP